MTESDRSVRLRTAVEFGLMIRTRRRELGMSQLDLALTIDSGERFIVDLEKGKPSCQLGKALRAAWALGIRLSDLEEADRRSDADGYHSLFDDT